MFFRKWNNNALKIAKIVAMQLLPAFEKYNSAPDNEFYFPKRFFDDKYIMGFSFNFAVLSARYEFESDKLAADKKGELMINIFSYLFRIDDFYKEHPSEVLNYMGEIFTYDRDKEFLRGKVDATNLYAAYSDHLKPDCENPIVIQALSMKLPSSSIFGDLSQRDSTANFIWLLTVKNHIEKNFSASK